ncbi:DUF1433 domain-containing protein [Isobaculum melis]|uniref:DUF1433 domain-containing protein n=1 Tax=Isobaculum melis TaxID=142588 RepID=A0A1H9TZN3_9LACT|nr:DUF1433 domain-containing protein [Isobaculum melis]SES02675.1 Protein of unknown function [Isobaculum melis]
MKKKRMIIIVIFLVLLGTYFLKKEFDKKKLIESEGPRIEKYLKYNFKDIKSVTFTDVVMNPTGIPHIHGYVNDDAHLGFSAGIYDEHYEADFSWYNSEISPESNNLYKNKTVTEIEKEEANQKK